MKEFNLEMALSIAKEKFNPTKISDEFLLNLVHSALSFESNDLKKEEVEKVLNNEYVGINSEKTKKIINQKNAFLRIVEMVNKKIDMNENELKDLHEILMDGFNVSGGLYRNVNISVKGSNHTPPSYDKVYDRMKKYFDYVSEGPKNDLLEYISYCHLQLAKIHPFLDGNGRLARLILNYQLMNHGLAPVIITEKERNEYHDALEQFKVMKDIKPFIEFLKNLELKSLEQL